MQIYLGLKCSGNLTIYITTIVLLWWRENLKLIDIYKGIASCSVRKGTSAFFWRYLWDGHLRHLQHPELLSLFSLVNLRLLK